MLALSVKQPWPYAIFHLEKDIENRDWWTNVRGRIFIHASAGMTKAEHEIAKDFIFHTAKPGVLIPPKNQYTFGALVGTVDLTICVSSSNSRWYVGKYGFVVRDPVRLPQPIPIKGKLGFWTVPKEISFNICERCGRSRDGHSTLWLMQEPGACEQFIGEYEC